MPQNFRYFSFRAERGQPFQHIFTGKLLNGPKSKENNSVHEYDCPLLIYLFNQKHINFRFPKYSILLTTIMQNATPQQSDFFEIFGQIAPII